MNKDNKIPSKTSPRDSSRGCLCWDTLTYSRDCCDGSLHAQGIGSIYGHTNNTPYQGYRIERCSDNHHQNVHYHGALVVGKIYNLTLENGHSGCYTVVQEQHQEGIHINSVSSPFDTCVACS